MDGASVKRKGSSAGADHQRRKSLAAIRKSAVYAETRTMKTGRATTGEDSAEERDRPSDDPSDAAATMKESVAMDHHAKRKEEEGRRCLVVAAAVVGARGKRPRPQKRAVDHQGMLEEMAPETAQETPQEKRVDGEPAAQEMSHEAAAKTISGEEVPETTVVPEMSEDQEMIVVRGMTVVLGMIAVLAMTEDLVMTVDRETIEVPEMIADPEMTVVREISADPEMIADLATIADQEMIAVPAISEARETSREEVEDLAMAACPAAAMTDGADATMTVPADRRVTSLNANGAAVTASSAMTHPRARSGVVADEMNPAADEVARMAVAGVVVVAAVRLAVTREVNGAVAVVTALATALPDPEPSLPLALSNLLKMMAGPSPRRSKKKQDSRALSRQNHSFVESDSHIA